MFPSSELASPCVPAPAPGVAHYATALVNRLADFYWERRLGVRTTGGAAIPVDDEIKGYGFTSYHCCAAMLDGLALGPADVVLDLGAGKGRVLCAAAQRRVRAVIGVEINPALAMDSCGNVARLRAQRSPVTVRCGSACAFGYDEVTAITLFHPFGAATMREVLRLIGESLARRPRALRIAYCNPLLGPLLEAQPWLERHAALVPGPWSRLKFPIHFYRSAPLALPSAGAPA